MKISDLGNLSIDENGERDMFSFWRPLSKFDWLNFESRQGTNLVSGPSTPTFVCGRLCLVGRAHDCVVTAYCTVQDGLVCSRVSDQVYNITQGSIRSNLMTIICFRCR